MRPLALALLLLVPGTAGAVPASADPLDPYLCVSTDPAWMLPPPLGNLEACIPVPIPHP